MKLTSALIITALFAVVLGAVLYSNQRVEDEETAAAYEKELLIFDKDAVDLLIVEGSAGRVECRRTGEDWQIVAPVATRGSRGAVRGVLANLERARLTRYLVMEEHDDSLLAKYGLDPAHVRVILGAGGTVIDTIAYGDSPTGRYVYVKRASEDRIGMTELYRRTGVDKDLYELRDKRGLLFELAAVTGLQVEGAGERVVVTREDEAWRIQRPAPARADAERVESALKAMTAAGERFIDDPGPLSAYGLDTPALELTVQVADGGGPATHSLRIGGAAEGGVYATTAAGAPVFVLDSTAVARLPRTVDDLRHRGLVRFERQSVDRIEFAYPDRSILCVRDESSWLAVSPPQPVVAKEVEALLFNLQKLEADAFPGPAAADAGLDPPRLRIRVWSDEEAVAELALGSQVEDRVYAMGSDNELACLVDKTVADRLTPERIFARE